MKYLVGTVFGIVCSVIFFFAGKAGSTETLQTLHRQIGNELIQVKKKHPESQTLVYSLLDQLSKYYSFSKSVLTKKHEYKKLLKSEVSRNEELQKNLALTKNKMEKMKTAALSVSKRIRTDFSRAIKWKEEREILSKKKSQWDAERAALIHERDALARERDALVREKDLLLQRNNNVEKKQA